MEAALVDYMNWVTSKAYTKYAMPDSTRLAEAHMAQVFDQMCTEAGAILPRSVIDQAAAHRVTEVGANHLLCLDLSRFTHDLDETQRQLLSLLMAWVNTPLRLLVYKRNILECAKELGRINASINLESNRKAAVQGARDMQVIESRIYSLLRSELPPPGPLLPPLFTPLPPLKSEPPPPTTAVSMNLDPDTS